MILLQMLFVFEVEVLEVPRGFRAWFQQSFYTSESFLMLLVAWMPWSLGVFQDLSQGVLVCRNALGIFLFIRVWGWVSDTWRSLIGGMCHSLIGRAFKTFSPRHVASYDWLKCFDFQGDKCQRPIGLLVLSLTRIGLLMSSLTRTDEWLVFVCILCPYFNDTWQISVGFWIVTANLVVVRGAL